MKSFFDNSVSLTIEQSVVVIRVRRNRLNELFSFEEDKPIVDLLKLFIMFSVLDYLKP
jgi:hypothetical protein